MPVLPLSVAQANEQANRQDNQTDEGEMSLHGSFTSNMPL